MNKLLIICGPTASDKTSLAAKLVKKFSGQIISADSRQVYQGMDIGTGKDKPKGVKILGYDLIKPNQDFSVAHFVKFALPEIKKIQSTGDLPILVGGTGLYLDAITQPFDTINVKTNKNLRTKLNSKSVNQLQNILKKINPKKLQSMNHSDQLNPRRLVRAIEVANTNLRAWSRIRGSPSLKVEFDPLWIGLKTSKKHSDELIEKRVDQRLKQGSQQEVTQLIKTGYSWDLPSMSAMGYKQWQPFFEGKADLGQVRLSWITAEKQYLRRQLTWFKSKPQINWFDIKDKNLFSKLVKKINSWYNINQ